MNKNLVYSVDILDPPTKYIKKAKRKIDPKTGNLKTTTIYLTANSFIYGNLHFSLRQEILESVKGYLYEYFLDCPKLNKIHIHIDYYRNNENFDIDNKGYFWKKMILDILKSPTNKQIQKASKYNRDIISLYVLPDDSAKYFVGYSCGFKKSTKHKMRIEIFEIKELELF